MEEKRKKLKEERSNELMEKSHMLQTKTDQFFMTRQSLQRKLEDQRMKVLSKQVESVKGSNNLDEENLLVRKIVQYKIN